MNNKFILLDMDGVLVDFHRAARAFYEKNHLPMKDMRWGIEDQFGIPVKEFWEGLKEEFWVNLPWTVEGKQILAIAEELVGPENICLCTSPVRTEGCMEGKLEWIRREMPDYARRFMITPVKFFAASPDTILIDDAPKNIEPFLKRRGKVVVVPRPWNGRMDLTDDEGNFDPSLIKKEIQDAMD